MKKLAKSKELSTVYDQDGREIQVSICFKHEDSYLEGYKLHMFWAAL